MNQVCQFNHLIVYYQGVSMGLVLSHWLLLDNLKLCSGNSTDSRPLRFSIDGSGRFCSWRPELRTSAWLCSWLMHRYLMSGSWSSLMTYWPQVRHKLNNSFAVIQLCSMRDHWLYLLFRLCCRFDIRGTTDFYNLLVLGLIIHFSFQEKSLSSSARKRLKVLCQVWELRSVPSDCWTTERTAGGSLLIGSDYSSRSRIPNFLHYLILSTSVSYFISLNLQIFVYISCSVICNHYSLIIPRWPVLCHNLIFSFNILSFGREPKMSEFETVKMDFVLFFKKKVVEFLFLIKEIEKNDFFIMAAPFATKRNIKTRL